MKTTNYFSKLLVGLLFVAPLATGLISCKKKKDDAPVAAAAAGTIIVKDSITGNVHWTADQHYLLQGFVYVVKGATLTIDAGTIIKGDKTTKGTLIIERGAKIMAQGTASNPIVFTSNKAINQRNYGDWGGVVLCGYAPNNWIAGKTQDGSGLTLSAGLGQVEGGPRSLYGGTDAADNSGVLSYVRIEFAGVALQPNNEINGLTLCSVGNGTTIDHIMVSYSGDDSYEWFGGTVNCKYLIAHRGWDDDFDTDNGYQGTVQFGMILRDPLAADYSGSHSFESDSRNENSTTSIITKPVFSNITAVGPLVQPASSGYNANFVCGAIMRRTSGMSIMNSVIIGYPSGIIIEDDNTANIGFTTGNLQDSTLQVKNTAIIGCPSLGQAFLYRIDDTHSTPNLVMGDADTTTNTPFGSSAGPYAWGYGSKDKIYTTEGTSSKLYNAFSLTNPDFLPTTSSVLVTVPPATAPKMPASFASSKFTGNSFIDKTATYVGAFNTTDWTAGWANYNAQTTDYGDAY